MINKQNLWFLTLFSLIIVLSIYYLTMPDDILAGSKMIEQSPKIDIEETDALAVLKIEREESVINEISNLQDILLSEDSTTEEKNNAYDNLKNINKNKGAEEKLETKINEEFKIKCFVKIDNEQIKVVLLETNNNSELANKIMRFVQSNYNTKMFITVKFQN